MLDLHTYRDLYPAAFKAYAFARKFLDSEEWRPLKLEIVMRGCCMEKGVVVRAMKTLVKRQYLTRRGGGPKPYEYRLLPEPTPLPAPPVKARAA